MKRRVLFTLFALGIVTGAWSQMTTFKLHVCGKEVTSQNMNDVLGDGTVRFDGDKTLTLNGASITIDEYSGFGVYNEIPDLEVVVVGSNTIESKQWMAFAAIENTHFKGSGTLRLKGYSWGLSCGSNTTTVSVSGGVRLLCEGGEQATAETPTYGGGFEGFANHRSGRCTTTLEVSGANTVLEAKGIGVASSLYNLKALVLSDGLKVWSPAGAAFDDEQKAVCRADGTPVAGKWVMIKGNDPVKGDVNGDGSIDVADISFIIDAMAGKGVTQSYAVCPNDHHPHWIDLGLPSGTLWACCNAGAVAPEDCGDYFTFEEAQVYNPPSLGQIKELLDNTTNEWTTLNGVTGKKFTGNNSGSVFLPAAGGVWDGELSSVGSRGNYWSSTPYDESIAYNLSFGSSDAYWSYWYNGSHDELTVRPVR